MTSATKLKELAKRSREALNEFEAGVESVRLSIKDLQRERRAIERENVSEEVALARVDEWVESMRRNAAIGAPDASRFCLAPVYFSLPIPSIEAAFGLHFAHMLADEVKRNVRAIYANSKQRSDAERQQALMAIDRKLLDLELIEEGMIRAADEVGLSVLRRPDANPLAVLAHQSVLP